MRIWSLVLQVKINKACTLQIGLSGEIFVSAPVLPLRGERLFRISQESKADKR